MPSALGQFLRFFGLMIEMLGFWALAFRTGTDEAGTPLPGAYPPRMVWMLIGVGFAVWLVGTILNFWKRSDMAAARRASGKYDIQL